MKRFQCDAGTFGIDQCMNGQTPLVYYDALAQVALQKSLRSEAILCYWETGVEGLFSQLQAVWDSDNRMVKSNPFFWAEYCQDVTIITSVTKSGGSVPSAGASVTVNLDVSSTSQNGLFSIPRAGYRAYIKENGGQAVDITAVNKTLVGANQTITLAPINNQVLDLTVFSTYTLLVDTLRMYTKGDTSCIASGAFVQNPPILRTGYIQKFEDSICIHEDELDGYAYDVEFRLFKGIDPVTGKKIDMWGLPEVTIKLLEKYMDSKNINTLFSQRDSVLGKGFDGLIPTADTQGMFTRSYDPASGISLKAMLFNMIRSLRKVHGCNEYMLLHDFGFWMDWSEAIAELVRNSTVDKMYSLFGAGGEGARNFQYYSFGDFQAFGYKFRTTLVDAFDHMRYGDYLADFGLLLPACKFKDTGGAYVPPVTYVNIEGKNPAFQKKIWSYDFKDQGCRNLQVFIKDSYGMEIHCASKMGTLRKRAC